MKPQARADALEARIADDAASVDGASHERWRRGGRRGGRRGRLQTTSVVVVHGGDAFASLQHKLEQSEDAANSGGPRSRRWKSRPPPSPAYTSVEERQRERLRAAEAEKDHPRSPARGRGAKPASRRATHTSAAGRRCATAWPLAEAKTASGSARTANQ